MGEKMGNGLLGGSFVPAETFRQTLRYLSHRSYCTVIRLIENKRNRHRRDNSKRFTDGFVDIGSRRKRKSCKGSS